MNSPDLFSAHRAMELRDVYRDGLLNDVLPFWLNHGIDDRYGGIMTSLERDGSLLDSDKSVWQQGRFTWLLGKLANHLLLQEHRDRQWWLEIAERNLAFLLKHCFDPDDGRMWFHVTREGQPIRKRRYAFTESFAAIAFGEVARATGNQEYSDQARVCFERFVNHRLDLDGRSKFTDTRSSRSIGLPMITINTAQQLRESIQLDSATEWIDRSIDEIRKCFCKPEIECVMETVGPGGDLIAHFDGRTLNPGHAIEGAWFIMNEGRYRNHDQSLIETGCQMLDWMWHRGWDQEHGGLLYFVGVDGRPVQEYWHDMKFWWPHNELIIATLLAALLTEDAKYWQWHKLAHDWAYGHFADPEYGEWYGYLRRDGTVSSPVKGNLWKGPFHLPRMQLKCWEWLAEVPACQD